MGMRKSGKGGVKPGSRVYLEDKNGESLYGKVASVSESGFTVNPAQGEPKTGETYYDWRETKVFKY